MDTNVLESTLKSILFDDNLKMYVFNIFDDSVLKYGLSNGNITNIGNDTFTNYLEKVKTDIQQEYLSGFMNVLSIPKMKNELQNGKTNVSYQYQTLNGIWHEITSTLITNNNVELIFSVTKQIPNNNKESDSSKYNSLINVLADSILKINNVFNLDYEKVKIKNVEEYINSVLTSITNSYPELKKSLNKTTANVSGRKDDVLLIVDDDMLTRNMIKKVFNDEYKIVMATNGKEAIEYLKDNSNKGLKESSDKVLGIFLDLTMPVMDGFAVLDYLSKNNYLSRIPVIIISGDYEKETKSRVYNYAIADMLEKPFDFEVVRHRISNFINLYKSSNSLSNLISDESNDLKDLVNPFVQSYKYDYENNIKNINKYIKILAKKVMEDYPEYDLNDEKIDKMADASMYYDIGFYSIPRTVLGKKGTFSKEDLDKIKNYPLFGVKMLNYELSLTSDALYKKYAENITRYYHENYNGTGYPEGIKQDEIPIESQIASICINYNNLYKKHGNKTKDIIISKKESMFNPKIIDSFCKVCDAFEN